MYTYTCKHTYIMYACSVLVTSQAHMYFRSDKLGRRGMPRHRDIASVCGGLCSVV